MHSAAKPGNSAEIDYGLLEQQAVALLQDESSFLANASNFAAFIFMSIPQVNWAGFYFPQPDALVLGPFGGKPACTRLPNGRGVCGKAFESGRTVVVDDVSAFTDHIVCDAASRSEIVVPLVKDGGVYGVFDIDSPALARFTTSDRKGIEQLVQRFVDLTEIPQQFRNERGGSVRIGDRIDIQTCRDHHVVLSYLLEDIGAAITATDVRKLSELLLRFKNVLLAHLRLEDGWLYPRLMESSNAIVREKAERYRSEMGGLRERFLDVWNAWSPDGAIAANTGGFREHWNSFAEKLVTRVHAEDDDLYAAAETDLS